MRKELLSGINCLLFIFGPLKRSKVFRRLITASVYGNHLLIAVRDDHRTCDCGCNDKDQYDDTADCQRIFQKLTHTILKKGGRFTHNLLLRLFLVSCRGKLCKIDLHAQRILLWKFSFICIFCICHFIPSYSNVILGSTSL